MATLLIFVLALAAIIGIFVWIVRKNKTDAAAITSALGLEPVRGTPSQGDDPLLGRYTDIPFAVGSLHGWQTTLAQRTVYRRGRHLTRDRSNQTVLHVALPRPPHALVRLEPARTGTLTAATAPMFGDAAPVRWPAFATGDAVFDTGFRAAAPDPAAAGALLDPTVRGALLAARAVTAAGMPANALGRAAGDLLSATFAIDADRATCTLDGTPTARLIPALRAATPALLHLAHAATAPRG